MNAEIIAVGAELLAGDVSNTNASFLSERLSRLGIRVTRQTAVDDQPESIAEALATAVARSPIIVFTGGLGPTPDDRTKEVVCETVGLPLVERAESLKRLQAHMNAKGLDVSAMDAKQAMFPQQAVVFENPVGTADGCAIESGNQCIVMLPGPPRELTAMFDASVEDYLMGKTDQIMAARTVKVFGMGESKVAELIAPLLQAEDPVVATYLGHGDIRIKITCAGDDPQECEQRCAAAEEEIVKRLGNHVYARENVTLQQTVVELLRQQGKKIATAESCTAGMLSEMLTDVSGASEVFELGVSAYANRIKQEMLNVPGDLLKKHGAVSPQVAEAMAKGAAAKGKADFGIGITGIAGPTGGTPEKPVGLVYISLYDGQRCYTRKLTCGADSPREKIRLSATMNALDMMRLYLVGDVRFSGAADATGAAKPAKKKKWWQSIIPLKGDKPAEIVRKVIMIVCVLVFIGSAAYIADYFYQSFATQQRQNELSAQFHQASLNERFKALLEINPDTVGWLTVPGTQCDNPVVKTDNNDTYLHTTFEGEQSKYGTLFADKACRIEKPSSAEAGAVEGMSDNIIIYGHHMRDGVMFGELKRYREFAFYQENPVIQFTTLYDTDTVDWKILSVFIIDTGAHTEFEYRRVEFENEYTFLKYVDECRQRSIINTGVDAQYGDKLVTLSTCIYDFNDARLVVVARRVRPDESSAVDLSQTSINTNAVYPAAYYKSTGTSGRTHVTSFSYTASNDGTRTVRPSSGVAAPDEQETSSRAPWVNDVSWTPGPDPSLPDGNMWGGDPNAPLESDTAAGDASSEQEASQPTQSESDSSAGEEPSSGDDASAGEGTASAPSTQETPSEPSAEPDPALSE